MQIKSTVFNDGEMIPVEYTCDGKNVNPPLEISAVPSGAKSLVIIMDDIDAPNGVFTHWLVYDIFPGLKKIDSGASIEGSYGVNTFGKDDYGGPCPHSGTHRYYFRVYALDCLLKLPWGADRVKVDAAMNGHVIGSAEIMGKYSRSS